MNRRPAAFLPGTLAFTAGVLASVALAAPAHAWVSVGVLAGMTNLDPHFADYQWNVGTRPALGAQVVVGAGPLGLGARFAEARSSQLVAGAASPAVHVLRGDLVARARVFGFAGASFEVLGSTGRTALRWSPSHVDVATGAGSIAVDFAPVDAWTFGAGFGVRHAWRDRWSAGLEVERQGFAMDTAHRSGADIVRASEHFSDWTLRAEVARVFTGRERTSR